MIRVVDGLVGVVVVAQVVEVLLDLLLGCLVGRHLDGDGLCAGELDLGQHRTRNREAEGLVVFGEGVDVELGLCHEDDVCVVDHLEGQGVDDGLCDGAEGGLVAAEVLLDDVAGRLALAKAGNLLLLPGVLEELLDVGVDFLGSCGEGQDELPLLAVLLEHLARNVHVPPPMIVKRLGKALASHVCRWIVPQRTQLLCRKTISAWVRCAAAQGRARRTTPATQQSKDASTVVESSTHLYNHPVYEPAVEGLAPLSGRL